MSKIKMCDSESRSIKDGCEEFLLMCKVRNYSKYTIKYYENVIRSFEIFYSLDNDIEEVTELLVNKYLLFLNNKGIAGKTIKTYIGGIRTVFYFFMEKGWIERFIIKMPKFEKPIKSVYTKEELTILLKKPDLKKCGFTEYRNWVIVNYLIGTGQRLNSIINIKIGHIDLLNAVVFLRVTKNRKETILPLTSSLVDILKEYLKYRKGKTNDYLFCNSTADQMSRGCITCAIRNYNRARGIEKTSIHMFRHSFAYNYLLNGGDVFRLQKLMTHNDISTTKEYLNLSLEDLQVDFEEYNPLENIVKKNHTIKIR
ncbi:tyrosine-type recombinase/integrase [Clostridium aminobutyricum]|uniref:Tyrosine-type recombinase/integrase n=1 Tax=Clostridium aminobutyricum TaxID=33953 RepID=A0A939D695_CLOAM|nr:tyrosine-type recombinase/integrase [Clostridium aminobutyricum]MBN7771831.1 tyrosine-type recombinase/integrase [Clostridium aminobutyricum]